MQSVLEQGNLSGSKQIYMKIKKICDSSFKSSNSVTFSMKIHIENIFYEIRMYKNLMDSEIFHLK